MILSFTWTKFADSVKEKSVLTDWLTSEKLMSWNFGTIEQRFVPLNWLGIAARFWLIGGVFLLYCLPYFYKLFQTNVGFRWLFFGVISPPVLYFNLYFVHDYYFMALTPLLFILIAMSLNSEITRSGKRHHRLKVIALMTLTSLVASWTIVLPSRDYKAMLGWNRSAIPSISTELAIKTDASDVILVLGCDWDPSVLYFADRVGIAAPGWLGTPQDTVNFLTQNKFFEQIDYVAFCNAPTQINLPPGFVGKSISSNLIEIRKKLVS
jgi:hypothetical protein